MVEARSRGYFGIGVEGVSKSANVGALLRTAHRRRVCFIVGAGSRTRGSRIAWPTPPTRWSTCRCGISPISTRLALPPRCVLVGVELLDTATDLPSFRHPLNAAYILGPERSGLSPAMLHRCQHVVRIPSRFALNLAVAGALVLYDRLPTRPLRRATRQRKPRRHPPTLPEPTGHGAPHFRRNIPDWAKS